MKWLMQLPIDLPPRARVLVAGAGGGFDVVCALPVALALREAGHQVHLANYSFTNLAGIQGAGHPLAPLYRIDADADSAAMDYCPELHLARWWRNEFREEQPVWCFDRVGVRPLAQAYEYLRATLRLDAVVVLDGGVDGLFLGDEFDLGTPSMDAVSILAASKLTDCRLVYAFTAFGTEGRSYAVRHADALRRIAELVRAGGMLGVCAALPGSGPGDGFLHALEFIHSNMPAVHQSIMASSIARAMKGAFGETRLTVKTEEAPVWVSALTLLYWFFDLRKVAEAKPYLGEVLDTDRVEDVAEAIQRTRDRLGVRPRSDIPI